MGTRRTFIAAAALCAIRAPGVLAQGRIEPLSGKLLVTGSSTLQPVIVELAAIFRTRHPGASIEVRGGGSGVGMSDALSGKADIGMVSRALGPEEKSVHSFAIARDGVGLITHRDNPVTALTRDQMHGIFTGRIANWKAVGGRDAPIELLVRNAARGSTTFIVEFLAIPHAAMRAWGEVGENAEVIRAVAQSAAAVSYVSVGEAERRANAGSPIRLLALEGIAATAANVRSGDFPLSRPLMLVTRDVPRGLARAFIEFALSRQAKATLAKHEFVPYED